LSWAKARTELTSANLKSCEVSGRSTTTDTKDGTITMNTSWLGRTLVAEGRAVTRGGSATTVKETLSRDGDGLVVEIVAGDKTSRLRFTRLRDVGPCETWPAPCKRAK